MKSHRPRPKTFNLAWILLVGVVPIVATWFLIPRDLEMAERFADDGHQSRSLSMLRDLIDREITTPIKGDPGTWEFPAMEALLTEDGTQRRRGGKKTRMIRILLKLSDEPEKCFSKKYVLLHSTPQYAPASNISNPSSPSSSSSSSSPFPSVVPPPVPPPPPNV